MKVTIIGAGVVGKATGKGLAKKGHEVVFVDVVPDVLRRLELQGYSICTPNNLHNLHSDITMFSVCTPSRAHGNVELAYLEEAVRNFAGTGLHGGIGLQKPLVVIRSTVPPGTTRKYLLPILEGGSRLMAGKDFGLCMQPEFLRANTSEEDFLHPWATVIGQLDIYSGNVLEDLYSSFNSEIDRVSLETAEFMKYVHNCFNATKISFANEMWLLGQKLGLDANQTLQLVSRTAEGFRNPQYGIVGGKPYGGACLPKDTKGLLNFAQGRGAKMPLLSAVVEVNETMERMPYAVGEKRSK